MNCKKCNSEIPKKRIDLGYTTCIDCSTVEQYGCVDIVYHKTGNTVQPMDKSAADQINKLAKRSGFGVMRGMMSGKAAKRKIKLGKTVRVPEQAVESEESFNKVGEKVISLIDEAGREPALSHLSECIKLGLITWRQYTKLSALVNAICSTLKKSDQIKPVYNAYGKHEPKVEKSIVSDDTLWAFRNWKR